MKKSNDKNKKQLKNVGTAAALTVALVTSNVSTLTYAMELEKEVNTISNSVEKEDFQQEVAVQEELVIVEEEREEEVVQEEELVQEEKSVQEEVVVQDAMVVQEEVATEKIDKKANVDNFNLSEWDYKEYSNAIILNKYNGSDTDIVIPGDINGKQVKMGTMACFESIKYTMTSLAFKEVNGKKVQAAGIIKDSIFKGYTSLESVDFSELDSSTITDMSDINGMFSGCSSLRSVDLSGLNTLTVTNMSNMFNGCSSLTSVVLGDKFNTSNTTNMAQMFRGCSSLENLDLSNFNTEQVTNMAYMFDGCSSLINLDLSNFNTEKVNNMRYMFQNCSSLRNLNLSNFNTEKVTDMGYMFQNCNSITDIKVNNFNTEKVTDMSNMFKDCSSLITLDLSSFNTSNVTTMVNLFIGCSSLNNIIFSEDFNTSSVITMNNMFKDCSSLKSLDLSNFNTSSAENMSYMFSNSGVSNIDLSSFNTSKVKNMQGMFYNTKDLRNIKFGNDFNTSSVTNMSYMFCSSSVESLDLSKFDTSSVTNMSYIFAKLDNIDILDLSSFNLDNVLENKMENMFKKNIIADPTGKITETDATAAEKELLVVATDKKLVNYNYKADCCLPVGPTLDANGGEFSNGETVNSAFKIHVVKNIADNTIEEIINNALSSEEPTREGYTFVSWETQPTITRDKTSVLDKLNTVYYAKWEAKSIENPDTMPPTEDTENPDDDVTIPGEDTENPDDDVTTPEEDTENPDDDITTPEDNKNENESVVVPEIDEDKIQSNGTNSTVKPNENNSSIQTGNAGALGYIGLGLTSILGLFITNIKKKNNKS